MSQPLEAVLEGGSGGTDAQVIVDTAIAAAMPERVNADYVYSRVVPAGASHEIIDLERFGVRPRRVRGHVTAQTVDDFVRYVQRHDDPARTTVWVDYETHLVVGVLDDHAVGDLREPEWGEHRALLQLRTTDEWKHWTSQDGKLLDQEAFAEHIEDGLPEIVSPDGATMLEVAQSIQGATKAEFKGAHRLDNGAVSFSWVEETTANAGQRGDLEIPERFELAIAPFLGEDPYRVKARLRYRIRAGSVQLGYRLERPGDVLRDAIDQIASRLHDQFTGDRVFVGTPRSDA